MEMKLKSFTFLAAATVLLGSIASGSSEIKPAADHRPLNGRWSPEAATSKTPDFGTVRMIVTPSYLQPGVKPVADYIKEKSGVQIELISSEGNGPSKFSLMIAAKEPVDGTILSRTYFQNAINKGMLLPLDELIERYGTHLKQRINPKLWEWTKGKDGKTYAVPNESMPVPYVPVIRSDWLKLVNKPVPATVTEFEESMKAIKRAKPRRSSSGKEFYPIYIDVFGADSSLLGAFLQNGMSWWKRDDGTYLPPEMDPAYKTYLQTLQNWYKEKLIYPECYVISSSGKADKLWELIGRDEIGAMVGWFGREYQAYDSLIQLAPDFRYEPIALAHTYDNGLARILQPMNFTVASVTSDNGAGFIHMLDWMAESKEHMTIAYLGLPGVSFEYTDRSNQIVRLINNPNYNQKFAPGTFEFLDILSFGVVQNSPKANYLAENAAKVERLKQYTPLDYRIPLNEMTLDSVQHYKASLDTAKQEAFIQIVTDEKPVSYWDEFIAEWLKSGMDEVIREKNAAYREARERIVF